MFDGNDICMVDEVGSHLEESWKQPEVGTAGLFSRQLLDVACTV